MYIFSFFFLSFFPFCSSERHPENVCHTLSICSPRRIIVGSGAYLHGLTSKSKKQQMKLRRRYQYLGLLLVCVRETPTLSLRPFFPPSASDAAGQECREEVWQGRRGRGLMQ